MDFLNAINDRISRRDYLDYALSDYNLGFVKDLVKKTNEEACLSILLIEEGSSAFASFFKSYGLFSGVHSILTMKGPKNDPHLREKIGYYGEKIALTLTDFGLGTCWIAGTFDNKADIFEHSEEDELVCIMTVGHVTVHPTTKEKIVRSLTRTVIKGIDTRYESFASKVPNYFIKGMRAVQKAPSDHNRQEAFFKFHGDRIEASIQDHAHSSLIDLGIAKLHFELGANVKFELGNPAFAKALEPEK